MSTYPIVHTLRGKFMELPRDYVNAFVVETKHSTVIIDTTLALSSAGQLRSIAESTGKPIEAVLLTHGHPDHYSGLKVFEYLPKLASQGCLEFAQREDKKKASTAKGYLGDDWPDVRVFPDEIIQDNAAFTFGGVKFTFRDLGPGESDSDGLWEFEADGVKHIFVGDLIALNCHCFFRDGHFQEWQNILDRLEKDYGSSSVCFHIGHGKSPSGMEVLRWQQGYNIAFLNAISKLKEKRIPVSPEAQQEIITAMQEYLPGETTLFLLGYEMDVTVEQLWRRFGLIK